MASSNLVLNIIAKDKASKTISGVGKSVGQMGAASVVSAAAIGAFGAASVKAFSESEQAQLRLEDAFKKFPKLADTNVAELNRLNSEMQRKTRYDDEAYAQAEASLAQYKLTGTQIKALTPLVADYAAKTGKDLPAAAEAVGKALLGKGRALTEVGIKFKDAGSVEANYTNITRDLRTQVGGFAEQEGKTAAGQAAILRNQFNDLQETVGSTLVPALTSVARVLTPVVEGFNDLPGPVKNAAIGIGLVGTAALVAAPKVLALKTLMADAGGPAGAGKLSKGIGGISAALGGPWGIAITGAVVAGGLLAKAWSDSKVKVDDLTESIKADSGALGENTRANVVNQLEKNGALALGQKLGISLDTLTDAALGNAEATRKVNAQMAPYLEQAKVGAKDTDGMGQEALKLKLRLDAMGIEVDKDRKKVQRYNSAMGITEYRTRQAAIATGDLIGQLQLLHEFATPGSAASARIKEEQDRVGARASGGPVMAGASYLVGERGPEVVTFGANGYVTPNHALGGTTIIVNALDPNESARAVVSALKAARAQGIAV